MQAVTMNGSLTTITPASATRALKPSSYVSLLYITMSVASIGLIIKAL